MQIFSENPNFGVNSIIGAYFRMGLVRMPSVRSYWETYMSYDGVNSALSRNRFWSILRNLHFVDNLNVTQETKDSDCVWKVRPCMVKTLVWFSFALEFTIGSPLE